MAFFFETSFALELLTAPCFDAAGRFGALVTAFLTGGCVDLWSAFFPVGETTLLTIPCSFALDLPLSGGGDGALRVALIFFWLPVGDKDLGGAELLFTLGGTDLLVSFGDTATLTGRFGTASFSDGDLGGRLDLLTSACFFFICSLSAGGFCGGPVFF